uniref:Calcitonin peptide-like domain-containing protein n=1 Tax=Laticauda laticaudata TaxID=8630 RepID=A0A8C5SDE0_LATLA
MVSCKSPLPFCSSFNPYVHLWSHSHSLSLLLFFSFGSSVHAQAGNWLQMLSHLTAVQLQSLQDWSCNTATCVTHRLADFLNRSGGVGKNTFVPTNVGAHAFGRRRRNI